MKVCKNCGSTVQCPSEFIKTGHVSCCPERHMIPVKYVWRSEYKLQARIKKLEAGIDEAIEMVGNVSDWKEDMAAVLIEALEGA